MKHPIRITINGESTDLHVEPYTSLLDALRDELHLTGTKKGCDEGDCGACTVMLDGKVVTSCLVMAMDANGRDVLTVEGLAQGDKLHPVQQAVVDEGGFQCAFCAPGFIMSMAALVENNPNPTRAEAAHALSGNLCRCGDYNKILNSAMRAAEYARRRG